MTQIDTSDAAVERLAVAAEQLLADTDTAALLRALAAERRALLDVLESVVAGASELLDRSGPGFHPVWRGEFRVDGDVIAEARAALEARTHD